MISCLVQEGSSSGNIKVPESCSLQSLILFELYWLVSSQLTSLLHGTSHAVEVCLCVCLSVTLSRSCCRLSSKVATLVEEVFRRQAMVYTAFTVETLLVFVYKLLTNSVSQAAAPRYVPSWHVLYLMVSSDPNPPCLSWACYVMGWEGGVYAGGRDPGTAAGGTWWVWGYHKVQNVSATGTYRGAAAGWDTLLVSSLYTNTSRVSTVKVLCTCLRNTSSTSVATLELSLQQLRESVTDSGHTNTPQLHDWFHAVEKSTERKRASITQTRSSFVESSSQEPWYYHYCFPLVPNSWSSSNVHLRERHEIREWIDVMIFTCTWLHWFS